MEVTDLELLGGPVAVAVVRERLSVLESAEPLVVRPRTGDPLSVDPAGIVALRSLPTVTVLIADPATVDPTTAAAFDVCLSSSVRPPAPFVAAPLDPVAEAVAEHPLAALALAVLLRDPRTDTAAAVAAESATYALLLGSADFARWRDGRRVTTLAASPAPVEVAGTGTARVITLNRPERHNAVDTATRDALVEAMLAAAAVPASLVVLRGNGPSFCAGGDLAEFGTVGDPATAHAVRLTRHPGATLAGLDVPTAAIVHGACIGAGIEIAAFADRVVASTDATFSLPELSFGLVPGAGGTVSIARRIGTARTAWMALTGATLDAGTAAEWGLVDEVTEDVEAAQARLLAADAER